MGHRRRRNPQKPIPKRRRSISAGGITSLIDQALSRFLRNMDRVFNLSAEDGLLLAE
jgi:hypothetical protein